MEEIRKISLNKELGPIVFIGSMNSMPMMYAIELKKLGYDIVYFVDAKENEKLSRPENHYPDIIYPYPNWIIEIKIPTQMIVPFSKRIIISYLKRKIKSISHKKPQLYFLNGFFVSLSSFFSDSGSKVIALSHGSDLQVWADVDGAKNLSEKFNKKSIYKFFPSVIAKKLIQYVVKTQYTGFCNSDIVATFPKGLSQTGDRVFKKLKEAGVCCYERYDISFDPLKNEKRDFKKNNSKFVIFSGVRFSYQKHNSEYRELSKGNDIIIKGLAEFYSEYKNIEVHFVEKGIDYHDAKKLCDEVGLSPVVIWHKEMSFKDLLSLYRIADVCFDQVGEHWVAAIGGYALWLGKPLIANDMSAVRSGAWPEKNPILTSSTVNDVYDSLFTLLDENRRMSISTDSKVFAENYLSPMKFINDIFDLN